MQTKLESERLFHTAMAAFRERGYATVTPAEIAEAAHCSLEDLYRHFPRKEYFILRLYEQLAQELKERVAELPTGTLSERFRVIMQAKLDLSAEHADWLRYLLPAMLDPDNSLGVLGPHVERIRVAVQSVFAAVILGATNAPPADQVERATRMLYTIHLGLVFLLLQDQSPNREMTKEGLELAIELLEVAQKVMFSRGGWLRNTLASWVGLPDPEKIRNRLDKVAGAFVQPPHDPIHFTLAENILRDLFRHRRLQPGAGKCADHPCAECLALHLPTVEACLQANRPIHLVLPAFPAKSANLKKVTGPLPDFGEELALRFLQQRCDAIAEQYPPGAKLTICSDGRVFSDLVGVEDADVTAYRHRLLEMIDDMKLTAIDVFDLDDVHPDSDYDAMRKWLSETYAEPLEALKKRTQQFQHAQQMFNGIHRFLFEDMAERDTGMSRTKLRNHCKDLAYEVIRRSNAWSRLVSVIFPDSLRLSIHPQPPHSEKIGILLTPAEDPWLTPWHGVALLRSDQFVLTRRSEAEKLGAEMIYKADQPSHFELADQTQVKDTCK